MGLKAQSVKDIRSDLDPFVNKVSCKGEWWELGHWVDRCWHVLDLKLISSAVAPCNPAGWWSELLQLPLLTHLWRIVRDSFLCKHTCTHSSMCWNIFLCVCTYRRYSSFSWNCVPWIPATHTHIYTNAHTVSVPLFLWLPLSSFSLFSYSNSYPWLAVLTFLCISLEEGASYQFFCFWPCTCACS